MNDRLINLRKVIRHLNADGALIWKLINVRYFAGFTGTTGVCLVTPNKALFITDSRYTVQAQQQVVPYGFEVVTIRDRNREIADLVHDLGLNSLVFEDQTMTVAEHYEFTRLLEDVDLVPAGGRFEEIRWFKSADEIVKIRNAVRVQEEAMEAVLPLIVPGAVESDIAFQLEMEMRKRGASGPSFDTIVGSGPRGAMPHGVASDKVIQAGELVVLDWGCIVDGYCSDQTLTVSVGEPSDPDAKKVFEIVRQAQAASIAATAPGVAMTDIDKAGRDIINAAGYGHTFGHGTGHAVGLEIHEEPRANTVSKATAQPGMVFTVEPGIYLEGRFGVRLEDIVLVTSSGCERLTTMHKNWRSTR